MTVVPDWVCEVPSPSSRGFDSVIKMSAYADAGVEWAWLVEPGDLRVDVFRREGKGCRRSRWSSWISASGGRSPRPEGDQSPTPRAAASSLKCSPM